MLAAMQSRSASRVLAVQALYQVEVAKASPEDALAHVTGFHEAPEGVASFAGELVGAVVGRLEEIDRLIAEHLAEQWSLDRLGKVEKAVLRLATAELIRDDTVPTAVILDEACELTRDYLEDPGVRFVNGVMDRIARSVRPKGYPEEA